jgi:hypothetical protein
MPMPYILTSESDRRITADALRLYALDCRKLAEYEGTLGSHLTRGAERAEQLAEKIAADDAGFDE